MFSDQMGFDPGALRERIRKALRQTAYVAPGCPRRDDQTSGRVNACMLDIDVRLGEILEAIPKVGKSAGYGSSGGTIPSLPSGINKKESHQVQTLFRHTGVVEQAKVEARENSLDRAF